MVYLHGYLLLVCKAPSCHLLFGCYRKAFNLYTENISQKLKEKEKKNIKKDS